MPSVRSKGLIRFELLCYTWNISKTKLKLVGSHWLLQIVMHIIILITSITKTIPHSSVHCHAELALVTMTIVQFSAIIVVGFLPGIVTIVTVTILSSGAFIGCFLSVKVTFWTVAIVLTSAFSIVTPIAIAIFLSSALPIVAKVAVAIVFKANAFDFFNGLTIAVLFVTIVTIAIFVSRTHPPKHTLRSFGLFLRLFLLSLQLL